MKKRHSRGLGFYGFSILAGTAWLASHPTAANAGQINLIDQMRSISVQTSAAWNTSEQDFASDASDNKSATTLLGGTYNNNLSSLSVDTSTSSPSRSATGSATAVISSEINSGTLSFDFSGSSYAWAGPSANGIGVNNAGATVNWSFTADFTVNTPTPFTLTSEAGTDFAAASDIQESQQIVLKDGATVLASYERSDVSVFTGTFLPGHSYSLIGSISINESYQGSFPGGSNPTMSPGNFYATLSVPEPSSLAIIGITAISLMHRRRK